MLTVKMLKPYYIKADSNHVQVILAYQYFSILIEGHVYHFVPREAKEIKINRQTKEIVNKDAKFSFQKGKDIIRIAMTDLISLPDFLTQLNGIVESYYASKVEKIERTAEDDEALERLFNQLEKKNVKRLIDQALDKRDEKEFLSLSKLL
ncbi:MAG TPA: IDEAL domain-containing protein [Bacillota bacterium]|nr:IDEAL domain-containing protein [Bacillota bacterium]